MSLATTVSAESSMGRLAYLSNKEVDEKHAKLTPRGTLRANKKAARVFRSYLIEKGLPNTNFEEYTEADLAEHLGSFYINARMVSGEMYKTSTLESIRHSLNRYLQAPPVSRDIDIMKDPQFSSANDAFRSAVHCMKSIGRGNNVEHHTIISESDLKKLYANFKTDTPHNLQDKVQFDIRFYFFRNSKGAETMHSMGRDTYVIKTDPDTGMRYVTENVPELDKDHSDEDCSAFMPECKGDPKCPVASFEKMLNLLHPRCKHLWQRPWATFAHGDKIWYHKQPVGVNSLKSFMTNSSVKYGLSQSYTNQYIRVSAAAAAAAAAATCQVQYRNQRMISVFSQKSLSSKSTGNSEKLTRGQALNAVLGTSSKSIVPASNAKLITLSAVPQTDDSTALISTDLAGLDAAVLHYISPPGTGNKVFIISPEYLILTKINMLF